MATYYGVAASSPFNWNATEVWAPNADGSGTKVTADANGTVGAAGDTVDLNGCAVTLNVNVTQALIQAATGTLTVSGTRTITGKVKYTGTSTSGMVLVGTGADLTVTGPGSGYALEVTGTGYGIVGSGSGAATVSNTVGQTAISNSSTGRAISWGSTGALSITGLTLNSSGGVGVYCNTTATMTFTNTGNTAISNTNYGTALQTATAASTTTINGNVEASGTANNGTGVSHGYGSLTLNGLPVLSATGGNNVAPIRTTTANATVVWTGSRTLAAGTSYLIVNGGGTLALSVNSPASVLTCANSGNLAIINTGTLTKTTAGGGTASIVNQSSSATATILGDGSVSIITGPTLPAAGDVDSTASTFGYAGSLVTPTCVIPAAADVESGVSFGAGGTEFTGTFVGGIPTGDIVAAQYVLTGHDNYTGGSAGTLTLPAVGDVQDGVVYGAAGTGSEGTFAVPAEADVAETVQYGAGGTEFTGTLVSGGDWTATEKAQIRYRLGIDGTENTPTNTPELGSIGSDWTDTEKSHIRYRLGIDGTEAAPTNTPTLGTIAANVTQWNGANVATPNVSGVPKIDLTHVNGTAASGTSTVDANVTAIAANAITAAAIAADAGTEIGAAVKTAVEAAGSHLALIKTKTDFLPSATAGSAGGVFIVGANVGGVSITNNAGDALLIQSTGGNGQGMSLVGNGLGSGLKASSGGSAGTAAIYAAGMVGMSINAIAGNGMEVIGTAGDIVADITGNVSGAVASVSGAIGSVGAGGITSSSFASGAITAAAMADNSIDSKVIAADAINAASLKADALTAIGAAVADAVYDESSATHNALGSFGLKINDTYTQIYNILDDTGLNGVVVASTSKTGYKLASDGLDSISVTKPTARATNFREMVVQTWMRFFNRATKTATELKTYADDGTTIITTQAVSDVAGTETQGPAT